MQLTVAETGIDMFITVLESRIDAAVATHFKDKLRLIVTKSRLPVRIDMQAVDFMDSSGLGAMIAVRKALPEALPIRLVGLTPNVERVFRLTRMDTVFEILPAGGLSDPDR